MEKLGRFGILLIIYALSFVFVYTILPSVVWVFGGSFLEVAQSASYAAFGIIAINVLLGFIFSECFDTSFRSKR
jgi:hypothetical protein